MKINQIVNENQAYTPEEDARARDHYQLLLRTAGKLRADAFQLAFREAGNVEAAKRLQDRYFKALVNHTKYLSSSKENTDRPMEEDDSINEAGEYSYTLEYNGEENGMSKHILTITNPEGESKVVGDDFTYFDVEGDELQAELESWFHKGMGVADASANESIEEAMYSVTVNGHEQRYRDFRDADVRIWKHIQGLEQKNNKGMPSKSPLGKVDPSKIILKRNGVEVPHKYTGKEKQPITGPLIGNSYPSDKLSEAMSDAYGIVSAEPEVEGSVEFKQHKNTDKGSVSIEASGEDMQELAKVLKLAGLTLPQDMYKDEPQASADDHEPEQEDVLLSPDHEDDKEESPCDSSDDKVSYETDKEILINYIKDKLKKSIS